MSIKRYFCRECETEMVKETKDILVCPYCDHSVDIEDYENEEETLNEFHGLYDNPRCKNCENEMWPLCIKKCKLFNRY
jgi:hypothetical protein